MNDLSCLAASCALQIAGGLCVCVCVCGCLILKDKAYRCESK